jgi:hypothetical protein
MIARTHLNINEVLQEFRLIKEIRVTCNIKHLPRKGDNDYIQRPENSFMLFRRKYLMDYQAKHKIVPGQASTGISKTIDKEWKSLSAEDRQYWDNLAREKKKEHEAMYPNYVYRPHRTPKRILRNRGP